MLDRLFCCQSKLLDEDEDLSTHSIYFSATTQNWPGQLLFLTFFYLFFPYGNKGSKQKDRKSLLLNLTQMFMLSHWSGCNTLNADCTKKLYTLGQFIMFANFSFILGQLSLTAFCIPTLLNLGEGEQSCINSTEKKN